MCGVPKPRTLLQTEEVIHEQLFYTISYMSNLTLPKQPTLADFQKYMNQMAQERGFADQTPLQASLLLVEEVGELMKCIRKSHANMRVDKNKTYEFDPAGEIADIFIVLTCIANQLEVDMEQAFRAKEDANKKRTWH